MRILPRSPAVDVEYAPPAGRLSANPVMVLAAAGLTPIFPVILGVELTVAVGVYVIPDCARIT